MTCFFPQRFVNDLRAFDFLVAVVLVNSTHVLLNLLPNRPALGVPEHQAWCVLVNVKQIEFTAQFAVIALLCFFQLGQVVLQIFFAGPSGTVNALQHFVFAVAAPIGTRYLHKFEVLELAGTGYVRAAAQIFKRALFVQTHIFIGGNAANDLCFVVLAHAFEISNGFITRQNTTKHGLIFVGQFGHALFYGGQIF